MYQPKIGDRVTTTVSTEAYYSGYGGQPRCTFEPGDVGTIAKVKVPYVTGREGLTFNCVDFHKDGIPYNQGRNPWRVGIPTKNLKKIRP